jgi:hypothetical protein
MARKSRNTVVGDVVIAPELNPRDTDVKYVGPEPQFLVQPSIETRTVVLVQSLNWYSRFFDRKTSKELILEFAQSRGVTASEIKRLRSVHEREYNISLGWIARMGMRGLVLTEQELAKIGDHLKSLLERSSKIEETVEVPEEKPVSNRPNVQEIMRDKTREAAGEIEGLFDSYLLEGNPQPADVNVVGLLTERNILPQHTHIIVDMWKRRRAEFEEVQDGKDADLKEGYSQYGKVAIRNLIKFCDAVLAGVASYISVKKTTAKPRKRKVVPVEKLVSKVKYQKQFKDDAAKIDLVSIHPSKIVGATEVWAYDTAKRKIHYYVADSHVGTLSVKGATIMGFDSTQSGMKTLRKPGDQLKKLIGAGKPAARKFFKDITAVQAQVKGRTNENLIILKAY